MQADAGGMSSIPGSRGSPGEGNGNPLHYSCLENLMDRGALQPGKYVYICTYTHPQTLTSILYCTDKNNTRWSIDSYMSDVKKNLGSYREEYFHE